MDFAMSLIAMNSDIESGYLMPGKTIIEFHVDNLLD